MKKKLFFVIMLGLIFNYNVNAKEVEKTYDISNIKYTCDDKEYYLERYIESSNKYIISDGENEKIYSDGKCNDLSIKDKLDLYNDTDKFIESVDDEDETTVKIYDTYYDYREGYILNSSEYSDKETYFEYDGEFFNQIEEVDKENINEYYVLRYFKHISSTTLNSETKYYVSNEENELFTLNEEENNEDYLNLYEVIDEDKLFTNEQTYVIKQSDISNIIEKNSIDTDEYEITSIIINDKVYYIVGKYDDEYNYTYIRYYDKDGNNVFKEFNDNYIISYDNYNLVSDLSSKNYEVYDRDFKLITKYSFDVKVSYDLISNDEDAYVIFLDEELNPYMYFINSELNVNYCAYYVVIGLIFMFILGYGIYKKDK